MTQSIADFVLEEMPDRVEQLAAALESGAVTLEASRSRLRLLFTHGPRSLDRMMAVLTGWRADGGTAQLLAHVLRGHLEVDRQMESRGPRCELVWTGDAATGSTVRSTLPVITEMLRGARRSALVMTYALWVSGGDSASVIARLADLSKAGVSVTFVLDGQYQEGRNIRELRAQWPRGYPLPPVYTWADPDDMTAKLHAKVLVIDEGDLLITSANLTGHGLRGNLEFGVRIRGRPAEEAERHIRTLIRSGFFMRVPVDANS